MWCGLGYDGLATHGEGRLVSFYSVVLGDHELVTTVWRGEARLCSAAVAGRACGCAEGPTGPGWRRGDKGRHNTQGPIIVCAESVGNEAVLGPRPNACGSLGRIRNLVGSLPAGLSSNLGS